MHGPDLRSMIRRDKELTSQNFTSISFNDFNLRRMESHNMVYVIELTVKLLAKFKVEECENFYLYKFPKVDFTGCKILRCSC
jgi:hypothetical protein